MEKMTVDTVERLRAVIQEVSPKSHAAFARMCNLQPASLSRLLSRQYNLTEFYVDKICSGVKGLNRDYLLGKSDYMGEIGEDCTRLLIEYKRRIYELEEEIKALKWLIHKAMIEERGGGE